MKEEKRMGRPFMTGKPKTVKITVLLDNDEHKLLQKKAKEFNISMAEYLRKILKEKNNN